MIQYLHGTVSGKLYLNSIMAAVNPELEAAYVRAMHGINFAYGEDGLREVYSELKEVLDEYPALLDQ
jgi:hypothetical protein